ncbi:hypothetical protein Cylst_6213 [Cylindrospermum stagnale PCC 7417]|uniref:vWA-MoxR associated protein N-terminal HTH domain-containing protein n=1 Tax=Cylindrospermum stagnale PCC 7417 TaxID=56107 RepID=K9X940_9NOST|nr:AAA-like domain-containing protein [Cylindrospermum stagnale]AFZ28177.1 hypothetical protein Cylst_6213 [Cylindrospermum stagnale PCC 7417]
MHVDEALQILDKVLLPRKLNFIESLVFRQSWLGQTYSEIAKDSAYTSDYIKAVGTQVWQCLSEAVGKKVTKKNLHFVFREYQQAGTSKLEHCWQQKSSPGWEIENDSPYPILGTDLDFPGGPVPLNSPFYIKRFSKGDVARSPIEELAYKEISKPGSVIRIKAPSQMGKSSLLNRILVRAVGIGYQIVNLDFQAADEVVFTSIDKFLRWLCANVSQQLNLKLLLDDYWNQDIGSKVSCTLYFQDYVLVQIDSPLVLALNEVNRVFEYPHIARDFLPLLRFWSEQAKNVEIFQKLRLVVVHSTENYVPLNMHQSPFNVGLLIKLPEFNWEQIQNLARHHGLNWTDGSQAKQLMGMVGGHPYLVRVALYHLCRSGVTLEKLLQEAPTQTGIYSDHLRSHLTRLSDHPELLSTFKYVVTAKGSVSLEPLLAYKLESMGLVKLEGNECTILCELYRQYFTAYNLREEYLPNSRN